MRESDEARGQGARGLMTASAVFYGGVAVLVCAGALLLPDRFGFRVFPDSGVAGHVLAGLAVGGTVTGLSWALVRFTAAGRRLARVQAAALADVSAVDGVILALTAGVVEEMFFRGALWTLVASFLGPWPALAITSLLFGAVHGAFRRGFALWSAIATVSGVLAGGLLMWSGTILAPVVMHVVVDAIDIPLLKRLVRAADAG